MIGALVDGWCVALPLDWRTLAASPSEIGSYIGRMTFAR